MVLQYSTRIHAYHTQIYTYIMVLVSQRLELRYSLKMMCHRVFTAILVLLLFCGRPLARCFHSERLALLNFKEGLEDVNGFLSSWNGTEDCCEWIGVSCNNSTGHVVKLDLKGGGLRGMISPALLELHHLIYLDLSYIDFGGAGIPKFIGSLDKLTTLKLSQANLSEGIPFQLGNLSRLDTLDLLGNHFSSVESLEWISHLSSLKYLDLTNTNLSKAEWLNPVAKLPSLEQLILSDCSLEDPKVTSSFQFNTSTSLQVLDLSHNLLTPSIYRWLFNFSSTLVKLDLSRNYLEGQIPDSFGNMVSLRTLSLSVNKFHGPIPHTLGNLISLETLDLGINQLEGEIPDSFGDMLSLRTLSLHRNKLHGPIPHTLGNLISLETLYLEENQLEGGILDYFGDMLSLRTLSLSYNKLHGPIPHTLGNLISLETLSLGFNQLEGGIPNSFGSMCTLSDLFLDENNLSGHFPDVIGNISGCIEKSLQTLELSNNSFSGELPSLASFSSLKILALSHNRLQGVSGGIGQFYQLERLFLNNNFLKDVITEENLLNLSRLTYLDLSNNYFSVELGSKWVPPFQLIILRLASCKLGPHFPRWLRTQINLSELDISNNDIEGSVPSWIWDISLELTFLNLSHNHLSGMIPDISSKFVTYPSIDLSFNHFEGSIPQFPSTVSYLSLSNNRLTGSISILCAITGGQLKYLDLSSNKLSGNLHGCWKQFPKLAILSVANNNFSGEIPNSIGSLRNLETLSLYNNILYGALPMNLKNCVAMQFMDLGRNRLSGQIPIWIGESLSRLVVLILRSNAFYGSIQSRLCHLQKLQILDLSMNNISGEIPKCIKNFKAMAQNKSYLTPFSHQYYYMGVGAGYNIGSYVDQTKLTFSGAERDYQSILSQVYAIDLSSNKLTGEIPIEITSLVNLVALNLSGNNLFGSIPAKIGQLRNLNTLDLSRNMLKGEIPASLTTLSFLSHFNISFNNLSGKIPIGTQLQSMNALAYIGNQGLCGLPLDKCHSSIEDDDNTQVRRSEDEFFTLWFYVPMELGFVTGFLGLFVALYFNSSWRYSYWRIINNIVKKICD